MAAMRGFSWSGPEARVLTCQFPFLRGQISFRPNISQPNFFGSNSLRIHENFKQFKLHARKKSTSKNEENTETDLKKPKKKSTPGRKKSTKSTKEKQEKQEKEEISVQVTSDLKQEENVEESVISEEIEDPESEKEETFVQYTSNLKQVENSEPVQSKESKDPKPPKISTHFLHQISQKSVDTSDLEPESKTERIIYQLLKMLEPNRETDTWRPLICCFGPAKLSFIPFAKPATRVIDKELHEHYQFSYWSPARFFRAAGSSADRVAVQLAKAGQKVDFLGRLGEDLVGERLFEAMREAGVRLRHVARDERRSTAVSRVRVVPNRDGSGLRADVAKKCAEDCFARGDVKEFYMKKVKMLYFNSSSLLDPDLTSALFHAIQITKSNGGQIFFDLILPLPLWQNPSKTLTLLKPFIDLSNFIKLTSQELKFLLQIPTNYSKQGYKTVGLDKREQDLVYGRVEREKVVGLGFLHDEMKVVFVSEGSSRVSYYTGEKDGFVRGEENVPLEPASCEMSAGADELVASIIKGLVREPDHLYLQTDPKYLEEILAAACLDASTEQFRVSQDSGFYDAPSEEEEEETEEEKDEETEKEKVEAFGGALYD